MGKKSATGPLPALEFRESDFAGLQPTEQAQLSGSLNRLSEKLALSRQVLRELEPARAATLLSGLHLDAPPDEDTPTQRAK